MEKQYDARLGTLQDRLAGVEIGRQVIALAPFICVLPKAERSEGIDSLFPHNYNMALFQRAQNGLVHAVCQRQQRHSL